MIHKVNVFAVKLLLFSLGESRHVVLILDHTENIRWKNSLTLSFLSPNLCFYIKNLNQSAKIWLYFKGNCLCFSFLSHLLKVCLCNFLLHHHWCLVNFTYNWHHSDSYFPSTNYSLWNDKKLKAVGLSSVK